MPRPELIIAIDQGTTSSRCLVLDQRGRVLGASQREFTQHFPKPGWVEHDAEEIWDSVQATGRAALKAAGIQPAKTAQRITCIGITDQRETTLLWDRKTSRPVHRAIVWQCRRTAERCASLKRQGREAGIRAKTGLVLDAYFSATKLEWLLKHVPGAAAKARAGRLAFGTVDSWLLWKLTAGAAHATDHSNASRTLLYDIRKKRWDPALLRLFGVPAAVLPKVQASASHFGVTARGAFCGAGIPITGIAGDQQAALFGQACVKPGDMKNTYGTGCFLLQNLGRRFKLSKHGLLTTLACGPDGGPAYAFEGAVFIGGAAVQWVRDQLGLIKTAAEAEAVCRSLKDNGGVYLVPAFVGLGAPHWDSQARGILTGLTRGSGRAQVVRAAVESMAYQSDDLLKAMQKESGLKARALRVDGGATKNDWLMQFQADQSGLRVERPANVETTALGAALLAGIGAGLLKASDAARSIRIARRFRPQGSAARRRARTQGWRAALKQARTATSKI
jgi:glycerol kinase